MSWHSTTSAQSGYPFWPPFLRGPQGFRNRPLGPDIRPTSPLQVNQGDRGDCQCHSGGRSYFSAPALLRCAARLWSYLYVCVFETQSLYVTQAGLRSLILLPQPLRYYHLCLWIHPVILPSNEDLPHTAESTGVRAPKPPS